MEAIVSKSLNPSSNNLETQTRTLNVVETSQLLFYVLVSYTYRTDRLEFDLLVFWLSFNPHVDILEKVYPPFCLCGFASTPVFI